MHSRLPQDQDPGEVPREEVHVAERPAAKVPPLSQAAGPRGQTHEAKDQFTCFLITTFNKREITLNSFASSFLGKLHLYDTRMKVYTDASEKHKN